ncbi:MAG: Uncharacterised protein [Marine Group II euryarchaeote MED-G33]|jgi:hypothetical protein|nr:MAG: Uncharacterised protein [Marine Group II euryarchaeote MED-G33]|tara:strand:- start:426 stop:716 length:291 start_codon:yes stop_codon:yes gene_type:complete
MGDDDPVRFGAEFGPESISGTTKGVGLATFKRLVWISNIGGLLLMVIALEMAIVYKMFWWALATGIAGILVALFPSNYEITGMDAPPDLADSDSTE